MTNPDAISPERPERLFAAGEPGSATFRGPSHDYGGHAQQSDDLGADFAHTLQTASGAGGARDGTMFLTADGAADAVATSEHGAAPPYTALPGPGERRINEAESGGGGAQVPPLTTAQHPHAGILRETAVNPPAPRDAATMAARLVMGAAARPAPRPLATTNDFAAAAARAAMRRS